MGKGREAGCTFYAQQGPLSPSIQTGWEGVRPVHSRGRRGEGLYTHPAIKAEKWMLGESGNKIDQSVSRVRKGGNYKRNVLSQILCLQAIKAWGLTGAISKDDQKHEKDSFRRLKGKRNESVSPRTKRGRLFKILRNHGIFRKGLRLVREEKRRTGGEHRVPTHYTGRNFCWGSIALI